MSENCNECSIKKYCDMLDDVTDNQLILDLQHNILLAIYEQGRADAIKFALNQIPCEKNCNCCLRNGISTCFVPEKDGSFYIQEMVDTLAKQLKEHKND